MNNARYILGIDPGLSGAMAFLPLTLPSLVTVDDLAVAGDALDAASIADRIAQMRPDIAVIEQVGAMPKQGVSSTFKFGRAYGTVIGIVGALDIPIHYVTPSRWKKHFRLPAEKEAARALALRLWPGTADRFSRKKDAGRAEAALIARFAAETFDSIKPRVAK